jgi:ABC-type lipoprotein export system ATPase subunit
MKNSSLCKIFLCKITKEFLFENDKINILDVISFTFYKGKSYCISGSSGAGKSTLLHIIADLDEPTQGSVILNDHDRRLLSSKERARIVQRSFGIALQSSYLIKELTVYENIMIKARLCGLSLEYARQEIRALLAMLGLEDKINVFPSLLSGGQQQRVALARAVIGKPDFLLIDEPTNNLDIRTGKEMVDFLLYCQRQWGMGLLINSHDPYVMDVVDYHIQLDKGILHMMRSMNERSTGAYQAID